MWVAAGCASRRGKIPATSDRGCRTRRRCVTSGNFTPGKDNWSPSDPKYQGFWKGGKHWSEILADDGEAFFKAAEKKDQPFLMMLCFNAAHDPRQAPEKFQKMYPYDSIKVPSNFLENYPYEVGSNRIRDEKLAPFPRTPYSIKVNMSEYYAIITHMDEQIGRILKMLDDSGKADNTVVIFSADHGLGVGQHAFLGKQNMYDHSVRVPWIIAGPGVPKGKKVTTPIYLQDAMATCLELGGAEKPKHIRFQSVMKKLTDKEEDSRVMYSSYLNHQRMVTDGRHKYIYYPLIKKARLYDLKADPEETKDLINEASKKEVVEKLQGELLAQMKKFNDPLKLDDPVGSYKEEKKKRKAKK